MNIRHSIVCIWILLLTSAFRADRDTLLPHLDLSPYSQIKIFNGIVDYQVFQKTAQDFSYFQDHRNLNLELKNLAEQYPNYVEIQILETRVLSDRDKEITIETTRSDLQRHLNRFETMRDQEQNLEKKKEIEEWYLW